MLNRRNLLALCCVLALLLVMVVLSAPRHALGQMTIPTRTPVPDGGSPDPDPTDDNGGGGNKPKPTDEPGPEPKPTDKPTPGQPSPAPSQPAPTAVPTFVFATETPISTLPAPVFPTETPLAAGPVEPKTPAATSTAGDILSAEEVVAFPEENHPFPQANPCGMPPTFTSLDAISVFAGPGDSYQLVGLVGATEVRPIVGRAAFTNWWVVQLDRGGRIGWLPDNAGIVHGYTGRVPIISAPDLNGIAPTPGGSNWVPTPDANCSAPKLLEGITADMAEDSGVEVPPSGKPDSLEGLPELKRSEQDSPREEEGSAPLLQTAGEASASALSADLTVRESAADPLITDLADTAAPLDLPAASTPQLPNLMPVAGLVLILAALFIGLIVRRNGSGVSE